MKSLGFRKSSIKILLFSTCLVITSLQTINAEPAKQRPIAVLETFDTTITMQMKSQFNNAKTHTRISGPNGFLVNSIGGKDIDLSTFGEIKDGVYHYEITSPTNETRTLPRNRLNSGRGNKEKDTIMVSETQTGFFRIKDGTIVTPDTSVKEK